MSAQTSEPARGGKPVLVLRKARQVLDAFTPDRPTLTAGEVQRRTGLPASTSLRLLQTLAREGFLDRVGDGYRPGVALMRWANTAMAGLDLVAIATPVLTALRDATSESAALYVRDGDQHICIAVVETPHAVVHILRVGQVLPLRAGSAGRVFLAHDVQAAREVTPASAPYTPHTLTDATDLQQAVDATRRDGYAVSFEERSLGAASLSAPVFDRSDALAAVVGIVCPIQRFPHERTPTVASHVVEAAEELSRRLGQARKGEISA